MVRKKKKGVYLVTTPECSAGVYFDNNNNNKHKPTLRCAFLWQLELNLMDIFSAVSWPDEHWFAFRATLQCLRARNPCTDKTGGM